MKIIRPLLAIQICIFFFFSSMIGQAESPIPVIENEDKSRKSIFEHLASDFNAVPEITLATDFLNLVQHKKDGAYQAAFLSVNDQESFEIKIRPRGQFRLCNCEIPPIKLNFSKKDLAKKGFLADFDKLKLVLPCTKEGKSEELLLKEYLTYRLYNQLTENSYQVQLVKITIEDIHNSEKPLTRYAFLIENTKEMAHRLGTTENEDSVILPETVAMKEASLNTLFQYMIGNEDWGIAPVRNLKVLVHPSTGKNILVPYDFDFSGLVNADYAIPSIKHQHKSVKNRQLQTEFLEELAVADLMKHFRSRQEAMNQVMDDFDLLSRYIRKDMIKYVEVFFKLMEKESGLLAFEKN